MRKPVTIRLDEAMIERIRSAAKAEHRTLTNFIETAVILRMGSGSDSADAEGAAVAADSSGPDDE